MTAIIKSSPLSIIIIANHHYHYQHHKSLMPSSTSLLPYSFSLVWELSSEGSGRLERWLVKCSPSKWENLSLALHNPHKKSGMAVCNYSSSSGEMGGRLEDWQTKAYWTAWWCSSLTTDLVPNIQSGRFLRSNPKVIFLPPHAHDIMKTHLYACDLPIPPHTNTQKEAGFFS